MTPSKPVSVLIIGQLLLSGCAQLTTNTNERAVLEQAAAAEAAEYLDCVRAETRTFAGRNVAADYVTEVVGERCIGAMAEYEAAEYEHLNSMYMLPDQMLADDVAALNKQARAVVAEEMAAFPTATGSSGVAAAAGATGVAAATATPAAPALAVPADPADERVYLDCIESQARRFAALQESAETIAEVAHNRCARYAGPDAAALEPRGRALALETVFEARVPADN